MRDQGQGQQKEPGTDRAQGDGALPIHKVLVAARTDRGGIAASRERIEGLVRDLGFDGKTLIHPSQVEPANEMWAPTADDIEYAERVIAAFDEAVAEGKGVVTVDGRMIENLHVDNARRVLATAAAIAALG